MLTIAVTIYFVIVSTSSSRILLYNTENDSLLEKFDCIYDRQNTGEEISYCQRPGGNFPLIRNQKKCENDGEKKSFRDLLYEGIEPNEVLNWSSSVEMADLYASIYYNRLLIKENDDQFVCQCTKLGTFGKYCEYQLTHNATKFSEVVKTQFHEKEIGDSWNTQRYGAILCYKTLSCDSSPLCLDWREICDGIQRCRNGIDEENCDKLEFNECEDDEFRCTNGMCIAEEFWFDGVRDCMDWSDEYLNDYGKHCPFSPNTMDCDEHLCHTQRYSCGDGECVPWVTRMAFQRLLIESEKDCFSKRHLNYMCEVSRYKQAWTLENGLCWPDKDYNDLRYPSWNIINVSNLTDEEKCDYLFRCLLTDNFEHDCPCDHHNCKQIMIDVCPEPRPWIYYPLPGLVNANIFIAYDYLEYERNTNFHRLLIGNELKCPGYLSQVKTPKVREIDLFSVALSFYNQLLCDTTAPDFSSFVQQNFSSPFQYHKFCWNDSFTFNSRPYAVNPDACARSGQCLSQYRIRDGTYNCLSGDEEGMIFEKNFCTGNVGRHRFQCYNDQHKCLTSEALGTGTRQCSNNYDESLYGNGLPIRQDLLCDTNQNVQCSRVREYIRQSSTKNSTENHSQSLEQNTRIPFRSYCDSWWDFDNHWDELPSSCQHWSCQSDQYQCRTGQCIKFDWLCDGEWDCADASDEEAIVLIREWSSHNVRLTNLSTQLEKCQKRYSHSPFSTICNISSEFGCLRPRVSNPLNVSLNHPCINLTQIGDEKEDCYNAYDEKNTFTAKSKIEGMWGFHFSCRNDHNIYTDACSRTQLDNCTDIVCSRYRDRNESCSWQNDFICFNDSRCIKNGRCNGTAECSNREDEYWCPVGDAFDRQRYRFGKSIILKQESLNINISLIQYAKESLMTTNESQVSMPIIDRENGELVQNYSYLCNRGITVLQINDIRCLCPPAYYGSRCQFFSDRISVLVHLDRKTMPKSMLEMIWKIQVHFLFNETIIDQHEFDAIPTIERTQMVKHKFYLLYLRSTSMIEHKSNRYFNRTDVTTNHPYSVHFTAFVLEKNNSIEEIGSWHYPIYFDYLPAFRLAVVLKFPSWLEHSTFNFCAEKNCSNNSICLPILNQNNSSYCSCRSGYYGINCSEYESLCESYCAPNAFCRPYISHRQIQERKVSCLCPRSHFGPRCNLKYNECDQNSCLNGGNCSISYDRSGEQPFFCICSDRFYGIRCEYEKASVHLELNMTTTFSPRATVLQLYDITYPSLTLQIIHQKVHQGLPSNIIYYHPKARAPIFGILKIYENFEYPRYFVMYVLNESIINITSSPEHCPHVLELLPSNMDQSIPIVFQYHSVCQNNTEQFCFYDENYLCLCQSDHSRVECFIHNPQLDHCDKCLSGGKCLQNDPTNPNDFVCFCPSCHQGHRCEFNLEAFGSTFDSLLVSSSISVRVIYLSIIILLFIIGLITNLSSFVTFKRPTPRKFGTGTYLLMVTCFNQLALFCLLGKFIQITFGISSVLSCRLASYLLSVFTRSTYWLTSWVTVDRILIILFPNSLRLKNARLAIQLTIITLIILLAMHIHEAIFYTTIQNQPTGFSVCVTDFRTDFVSVYNRVSTPIHYIVPFLIQTISITLLIVLATRSRVRATGPKSTFYQVLKTQFESQKELYITPALVIFSISPQVIVTFSFACKDLNEGQRHMLLCAYLLSYAPQVFGFILYVLPSTSYKKEFGETLIGKKFYKWMLEKKKIETVASKNKHTKRI